MKTKKSNLILSLIYIVLNVVFVYQLLKLSTLPPLYTYAIIGVLAVLLLLMLYSQLKKRQTFMSKVGKVFIILLSILLIVGNVYLYRTDTFLDSISGGDVKHDTVSIIVKADGPYNKLEDVKDLIFGKEDEKADLITEAIYAIEDKLDIRLDTQDYPDYPTLAKALLNDEVKVIILNEAFRNFIEDEYPDFREDTKVIYEHHKKTVLEKPQVRVDREAFTVMISGIDIFGSITNNSRSDVNMLATINPNTKEILLISIPRDYYLPLGCQNNALDKLTHSGIYGIDCTMQTVGKAFGIDIDFYARVNFNSLINVVNAVGGVTVNVDTPFTVNEYSFPAGPNYLDGNKALTFVRDREHQQGGDRGRGQNQMKVVTAIIDKMTSPAIITNYNSILGSLEGSVQTNMSSSDITSLVKLQLNDMSSWNIQQYQVDGTGANDYSYALGGYAYVMYPNQDTIDEARALIRNVMK